jgi:hypothetical protein
MEGSGETPQGYFHPGCHCSPHSTGTLKVEKCYLYGREEVQIKKTVHLQRAEREAAIFAVLADRESGTNSDGSK